MKIVAVVPIKLTSRRLPQKNIKPFTNGKPLSFYIFNTLLAVDYIDEVYVYCSDEKIKKYIPENVIFKQRSKSLDTDTTSMNEVLKAFSKEVPADIYVMTHATSPFVSPDSITRGLKSVISGDFDSAFAVKKIQDFLWKNNKPINYTLDRIPRTQDLEPIYEETSGFYIFNQEILTKFERRIGNKPFMVEVSEIEAIDIDEEIDFIIADSIFNFLMN